MDPSCSPTCETYEASISALIDGELESPEQLPAIDHLLECASCQDFYGRARVLGSMVFGATSAEPAPPEIWDRIATETGLTERGTQQSPGVVRRFAPWLRGSHALAGGLGLAAGLILTTGLWLLRPAVQGTPVPVPSGETGVVEVVLEQDRGSMSDQRFLELTTEILRADRGYHRKLLEIMRAVDGMAAPPEGSGDEPAAAAPDGFRHRSAAEDGGDNDSLWSGDRL